MFKPLLAAALLASAPSPAAAAVVFSQAFDPNVQGANFSQGGNALADDFSLASATTLRSAEFWGVHWISGGVPANSTFNIRILTNNGSNYGTVVGTTAVTLVSRIDTGFDHNTYPGANLYDYVVDFVTPIAVAANTSYWFEVVHSSTNNGTSWAWQRSTESGTYAMNGSASAGGNLSFNLRDSFSGVTAVPEPAMLGLFGLGAIGLGLSRRRRRA